MHTRLIYSIPIVLALVVLAYYPGLHGGFAFDDYSTVVQNPHVIDANFSIDSLKDAAWSGGAAGKLRRPIPMLSFAANAIVSGASAFSFKLTNLAVHLVNGLLVFVFARLIFERALNKNPKTNISPTPAELALIAAVVWLVHPINLTSVLYVVQRMTSLAAMFSLLACISYCVGRNEMLIGNAGKLKIYLATPLFIILGIFSKENATLAVPLIALIEVCFYRFESDGSSAKRLLVYTYAIAGAMFFCLAIVIAIGAPNWIAEHYQYRAFSPLERLLTEARVMWFYLSLMLLPRLPEFALYHDDILLSKSLFEPVSTFLSILAIAACALLAIKYFKRRPFISFIIFWFLIGHALESTIMPLDIAHEHRNYLPGLAIGMGMVWLLAWCLNKCGQQKHFLNIGLIAVILLASLTFLRATGWADPISLAKVEAENHPGSFRSMYAAGRVQYDFYNIHGNEDDYQKAVRYLMDAGRLDTGNALPLIAIVQLAYAHGDEPAEEIKTELKRRLKTQVTQQPAAAALGGFVECRATEENCSVPSQEIVNYYYSALQNRTLRPAVKAIFLSDFAVLSANEAKDTELALRMVNEAIDLMPEISAYHLLRARLLIHAEDYDQAALEIEKMRTRRFWKDRIRIPEEQLQSLARSLSSH